MVSSNPIYYNAVACLVGYLAAFYFLWESVRNCIIVYLIAFELILVALTIAVVYGQIDLLWLLHDSLLRRDKSSFESGQMKLWKA